jgi:hypothetical protein
MGFGLYRTFRAAGLGEPAMWMHTPLGGAADWPGYELEAASLRSVLPLLARFGIATAAEVDVDTIAERIRAEVRTSGQPAMIGPHVAAWARKP